MTVVALCSAKGAPGVTTLACLLGAVWPMERSVVVAECDPSGGDIAARFGCDEQAGMAAFVLSARHAPIRSMLSVEPYLQHLPGGLEVLVGASSAEAAHAVDHEVAAMCALAEVPCDVIADCGRIDIGSQGQQALVAQADAVLVVTCGDASSLGHAGALADRLGEMTSSALGLVVVGSHHREARSATRALRMELATTVPWDPAAAAVVRGEPGSRRRLLRSPLVVAAETLRRWVDHRLERAEHGPRRERGSAVGRTGTWGTVGEAPLGEPAPRPPALRPGIAPPVAPATMAQHAEAPPSVARGSR